MALLTELLVLLQAELLSFLFRRLLSSFVGLPQCPLHCETIKIAGRQNNELPRTSLCSWLMSGGGWELTLCRGCRQFSYLYLLLLTSFNLYSRSTNYLGFAFCVAS